MIVPQFRCSDGARRTSENLKSLYLQNNAFKSFTPGVCLGWTWRVLGVCLVCAWGVLGVCLGCAWGVPGRAWGVLGVTGVCLALAWGVLGVCLTCL